MKKVKIFVNLFSTITYSEKAAHIFVDFRIKCAGTFNSRGKFKSLHSAELQSGRPVVVFVSNAHVGPIIEALLFASGEKWPNI
jgi:hypothetical protein